MKPLMVAIAALAVLGAAPPGASQDWATGRWVVSGKVAPLSFTLNCQFAQSGETLTGVCVDGATSDPKVKGGRRHALTQGRVSGDHIAFSYQSSLLLRRFNVDYSGVRRGDHLSGQILVPGSSGAFTGDRAGS